MSTFTATLPTNNHRVQLVADAVVSAYIRDIARPQRPRIAAPEPPREPADASLTSVPSGSVIARRTPRVRLRGVGRVPWRSHPALGSLHR
jgi:hypothetical protein